ncbi:hypothetical protein [Streptomyces catenulae]|uniref:Integral membrane protein n=1 Tax=Streptomyces catenulae TaxID=66875 RepID=A0ABV2Z310_9ACTN|nr:hypothetical protein [Streptomyces catenulae]
MGRGAYGLARVAVIVRAPVGWLWWSGVLAAGIGALPPGAAGRRIGVLAGIAGGLITAYVVWAARRRRWRALLGAAERAGRAVVLQDRAVTLRAWRRAHRRWLLLALPVAVASSFVLPVAGGLLLCGAALGLWAKARWLGRWEREHEALLWVRTEAAAGGGAAGRTVPGLHTTGLAAGDAAPGGARRPRRRARSGSARR